MSSPTLKYFAVEISFRLITLFWHFLLIFLKSYFIINSSNWKSLPIFSQASDLVSGKLSNVLVLSGKVWFGLLVTCYKEMKGKKEMKVQIIPFFLLDSTVNKKACTPIRNFENIELKSRVNVRN